MATGGMISAAKYPGPPSSFRTEYIVDPVLNMKAFSVVLPSNWKYQGAMVQGNSCLQIAFPVTRSYSPDGLSEWRKFPMLVWAWSTSGMAQKQHEDCLNIKSELNAEEFAKRYAASVGAKFVRDAPVPQQAIDNLKAMDEQMNANAERNARILRMQGATQHTSIAGIFTETQNGSFAVEERYQTKVTCVIDPNPRIGGGRCWADLSVVRAPKGQLQGLVDAFQKGGVRVQPLGEWEQKYLEVMRNRQAATLSAFREQQQRAHEIRMEQGRQFQAALQRSTDSSMNAAIANSNARHTVAADVCDYVLDQQTVVGPSGTTKISNAYGHTWEDGAGNYYQTNNPNANPNGVLSGNWTQAQKVHGDGTPY